MTAAAEQKSSVVAQAIAVSRRYGRRWALMNVDFDLARGRAVALVGRNGSGKSTLLRLLATAIRPDRGRIVIEGFDSASSLYEARTHIAYLGHVTHLYETLSARANLEVAASMMGISDVSVPDLLDRVGLSPRRVDPISTFSAGMKKRVSLARLLLKARTASVVLLDEPHSALDREGFKLLETVVASLKGEGKSIAMATHLFDRASDLCDDAVALEDGQVMWRGSAAELPELGFVGGGA